MGIDPWIFAAQIVNFLILFVALRRWAFGPLGAAIEERRRHVADVHAEADRRADEARRALDAARQERAEAERERAAARSAADQEMHDRKAAALAALDADLEREKEAWREGIERDLRRSLDVLDLDVRHLVVDEVRHAIEWLAATDLTDAQAKAFTEHLRQVDDDTWDRAWRGLPPGAPEIVVRSGFDPPEAVRDAWIASVRSHLEQAWRRLDGDDRSPAPPPLPVTVVRDPAVRMGAVLDVGGLRLGGTDGDVTARLDVAIAHAIDTLGHAGTTGHGDALPQRQVRTDDPDVPGEGT